jgi:hypothetical protein
MRTLEAPYDPKEEHELKVVKLAALADQHPRWGAVSKTTQLKIQKKHCESTLKIILGF